MEYLFTSRECNQLINLAFLTVAEERKMKTADGKVRGRMGFLFKSLQRDASGEHNASWNIILHTLTLREREISMTLIVNCECGGIDYCYH